MPLSNVLLLLLPSSIMALEDEGQRKELTREEWERRVTIPLLCRLVSEQHHQHHSIWNLDLEKLGEKLEKTKVPQSPST
jgi:hypothetical protein